MVESVASINCARRISRIPSLGMAFSLKDRAISSGTILQIQKAMLRFLY
jgi:hypothetical protein